MKEDRKIEVSRYMSYLLRHNPENLKMDDHGFVSLSELSEKVKERYHVDKRMISEIVEKTDKKRFEASEDKIRALYGHTIPVKLEFAEDKTARILYHGTTLAATSKILRFGLKPMKRGWVHLSPTIEIAREVGLRRTRDPVILIIDAGKARKNGVRFYKATDKVYLCSKVPSQYIAKQGV